MPSHAGVRGRAVFGAPFDVSYTARAGPDDDGRGGSGRRMRGDPALGVDGASCATAPPLSTRRGHTMAPRQPGERRPPICVNAVWPVLRPATRARVLHPPWRRRWLKIQWSSSLPTPELLRSSPFPRVVVNDDVAGQLVYGSLLIHCLDRPGARRPPAISPGAERAASRRVAGLLLDTADLSGRMRLPTPQSGRGRPAAVPQVGGGGCFRRGRRPRRAPPRWPAPRSSRRRGPAGPARPASPRARPGR